MAPSSPDIDFGLSEEEKHDLERMIGEFQKERSASLLAEPPNDLQKQIDLINKRLERLTRLFLTLDRRIKPLHEVARLTVEKSDLLNHRINTLLESIPSRKAGEHDCSTRQEKNKSP